MSTRRTPYGKKAPDPLSYIQKRLAGIRAAIARLEQLPAGTASVWASGQLAHFRKEERELASILEGKSRGKATGAGR
jgi:hypothetical protein